MVVRVAPGVGIGGFDLSQGWGLTARARSRSASIRSGSASSINYIGVPLVVSLVCIAVVAASSTTLGLTIGRALGAKAESGAATWGGIILILTGLAFAIMKKFFSAA